MGDAFGSGVVHYRSQKELEIFNSMPPTPRHSIVSASKEKETLHGSNEANHQEHNV